MPFKTDIPEPAEDHKDFVPIGQYKKLQKSLFESQVGERYQWILERFLSHQGTLESSFLSYQATLESFFVILRDT